MHLRLKLGVASALDRLGVLSAIKRLRSRDGLVLTFHRVLRETEIAGCYEPHIGMRADCFDQLLLLLKREYDVVPLDDLLSRVESGRDGNHQVALTFDDGWEDTFSVAGPLLRHHHVPATVFVCTALLEGEQMLPEERFTRIWNAASLQSRLNQLISDLQTWRVADGNESSVHAWGRRIKHLPIRIKLMMLEHLEHAYEVPTTAQRHFLTWDQVRIMRRDGIDFGSHTARHVSLDAEDPATVLGELLSSQETITRELGTPCTMLAYPNGAHNEAVLDLARKAGFRYAFTTERGFLDRATDPLAIPRLSMADPVIGGCEDHLHPSRTRLYLQQISFKARGSSATRRSADRLKRLQSAVLYEPEAPAIRATIPSQDRHR